MFAFYHCSICFVLSYTYLFNFILLCMLSTFQVLTHTLRYFFSWCRSGPQHSNHLEISSPFVFNIINGKSSFFEDDCHILYSVFHFSFSFDRVSGGHVPTSLVVRDFLFKNSFCRAPKLPRWRNKGPRITSDLNLILKNF